MRTLLSTILVVSSVLLWTPLINGEFSGNRKGPGSVSVPILLYHRFGPAASDSMTTTTKVFRSQLEYIMDHGFTVIPLRQLVDYYLGKGPTPSPGSVVIVADDAHKSVYTDMLPIVKQYNVPVTLFIYPSAIERPLCHDMGGAQGTQGDRSLRPPGSYLLASKFQEGKEEVVRG